MLGFSKTFSKTATRLFQDSRGYSSFYLQTRKVFARRFRKLLHYYQHKDAIDLLYRNASWTAVAQFQVSRNKAPERVLKKYPVPSAPKSRSHSRLQTKTVPVSSRRVLQQQQDGGFLSTFFPQKQKPVVQSKLKFVVLRPATVALLLGLLRLPPAFVGKIVRHKATNGLLFHKADSFKSKLVSLLMKRLDPKQFSNFKSVTARGAFLQRFANVIRLLSLRKELVANLSFKVRCVTNFKNKKFN